MPFHATEEQIQKLASSFSALKLCGDKQNCIIRSASRNFYDAPINKGDMYFKKDFRNSKAEQITHLKLKKSTMDHKFINSTKDHKLKSDQF